MPTGYTAAIKDGITFQKFALDCARAFGATITMRDDSMDAEIPDEFKPNPYYLEHFEAASAELAKLVEISPMKATRRAKDEYREKMASAQESMAENDKLREKYSTMLKKAEAWHPPTTDHIGLKKFMIEQISSSIDFDCSNSYYLDNPPKLLSGDEWLKSERDRLNRDVGYYLKEMKKENERCAGRTEWVKALRDSL